MGHRADFNEHVSLGANGIDSSRPFIDIPHALQLLARALDLSKIG